MAVFAVKYLKSLGYPVANNAFRENSWYFRNALVRACYENPLKGIAKADEPLERFFRNLLLGEDNELKSRYLRIGLSQTQEATLKAGRAETERRPEKGGQKTSERLWQLLKDHPHLSQAGLVAALGIARSTVQKHIDNLKGAGRLRRIGPDKGGHWEAV